MNRLFRFKTLVTILACMAAIQAQAYDFSEGGIYYNITSETGNTVEVTYKDTNFNYYSGTVTIPSTVTHSGTTYTWHEFCHLPPMRREKIDFIVITPTIRVSHSHIEIPNTEALISDHNPHWADLEF